MALAMSLAAASALGASGFDPGSPAAPAPASIQDSEPLQPGGVLRRELAGGEKHAYPISLPQGQWASVTVEPRGLEVVARLLDPQGSVLAEAHSGAKEARLDVVAGDSVLYRVEIEPEYPRARGARPVKKTGCSSRRAAWSRTPGASTGRATTKKPDRRASGRWRSARKPWDLLTPRSRPP
jgi:hypothetical protein